MPVARRIFEVADAMQVKARNGSKIGALVGAGNCPSIEYGYFDEYWSIRTTCSGTHRVATPSRSALAATDRSRAPPAIRLVPIANSPIFIIGLRARLPELERQRQSSKSAPKNDDVVLPIRSGGHALFPPGKVNRGRIQTGVS